LFFKSLEEAKRISVAMSGLMPGCNCIQALSVDENGNAVAL